MGLYQPTNNELPAVKVHLSEESIEAAQQIQTLTEMARINHKGNGEIVFRMALCGGRISEVAWNFVGKWFPESKKKRR